MAARLFWTVVTLVPLIGLVAFAVWRDPLRLRATRRIVAAIGSWADSE